MWKKLDNYINIRFVFLPLQQTTKAFLPSTLENNHGHVVTIASSAGLFGVCCLCDYCASKFGLVGFNESLMMELGVRKKAGVHNCRLPILH